LAAARRRKRSPTSKKVDLPGIDIASLARGYGCDAARLDDIAAVKKAATETWGEQRPTVPEIPASTQVPPLIYISHSGSPKARPSARGHAGIGF
jgi:thiamine pyrophosphate-dependent acetolactate synthase large subunit-like protein